MRALLSRRPGGPETLELGESPEPVVTAGQVRVAVRACGVNFPDLLIIQDLYQVKPPRPFAPEAALIGECERGSPQVILDTAFGGQRSLDELEDDPLPRIC